MGRREAMAQDMKSIGGLPELWQFSGHLYSLQFGSEEERPNAS